MYTGGETFFPSSISPCKVQPSVDAILETLAVFQITSASRAESTREAERWSAASLSLQEDDQKAASAGGGTSKGNKGATAIWVERSRAQCGVPDKNAVGEPRPAS